MERERETKNKFICCIILQSVYYYVLLLLYVVLVIHKRLCTIIIIIINTKNLLYWSSRMGNCFGKVQDKERRKRNKEINRQLERERSLLKNEVKLLLLGAGESGKSTILKQMRLIHDNGYWDEERESYREIIFSNTLQSIKVICEALDRLEIPYGDEKTRLLGQLIRDSPLQLEPGETPSELLRTVKILWNDNGVQECYRRSREFQLNDSAK